jgi:hypothetical protein
MPLSLPGGLAEGPIRLGRAPQRSSGSAEYLPAEVGFRKLDSKLVLRAASKKPPQKVPRMQTDWHTEAAHEHMNKVIRLWRMLPSSPTDADPQSRGGTSRHKFAKQHAVPPSTFRRRLNSESPMESPLIGRTPLMKERTRNAVGDAVARFDEHNNGKDVKETLEILASCFPDITSTQLKNMWQYSLKKHPALTGRVTSDHSEAARTNAITEVLQRKWYNLVMKVREELERKSPGKYQTPHGTFTYAEKRAHFVIGSDEECVVLSQKGNKLIGKRGKKHHMVHSQNSRSSSTALRTGSAAGQKGPSMYILGRQLKYVDTEYLTKHGAPPGSILTHNAAAYMTNETWDEHVEEFCVHLRNIDEVVRDNPNWWIEWHIDGFQSKVDTLKGQETMARYKIQVVQSHSHSSQVNQAFDDLAAKESKRSQREWSSTPRKHAPSTYTGTIN